MNNPIAIAKNVSTSSSDRDANRLAALSNPNPLATVAATEALHLSCSSDDCHIARSEFELLSAGEAGVLTYPLKK